MTAMTEQQSLLALARFGALCLCEHRKYMADLDGGWLQETAIECGLLETRIMDAPCGGECMCGDFPTRCYFAAPAVAKLMTSGALERSFAKNIASPEGIREILDRFEGSYRP